MTIFKLEVEIDVPHGVQPLHYKPLMDLILKAAAMPETVSWECTAQTATMGKLIDEDEIKTYEGIVK